MTDQRFTELLGKQLAGEISPDESVELESILADNEALRAEYKQLQTYFESETAEEENIDLVFDRIRAQIQVPDEPRLKVAKNKGYSVWLKIAAVAAIVLAGVLVYNREAIFFNKTDQLALKQAQTKATEIKTIILADGSTVKMNSESSLRYPEHFSGDTRNVYLSGEAFFEVKKDAQHPFIVHTEQLAVKVLGTAFDVKAYQNDAFIETTLIRGSVAISLKNNTKQTFTLKPNDKFTLVDGKSNLSQLTHFSGTGTDRVMETAWTNHELIYKNNRFDEIAKLFERWYDVKITFKEPELKAVRFTGHVDKETIAEALNVLKLIENFNYSIKGKNVYIYR
ncbi:MULTISPECIES: FecR domain-containing protein [unclassified Pedobacter]|uniref:FecR domain-containing protein n=1 Tax=unclassified Pedobacter TaxID=2628915 RepID=UPI00141DB4E3|nr:MULTISPECIES: FecR domain-containing protein [unclassified Pedobacter]NII84006.1 ferric-dicitrate binding protein FerR (iron transport regulator) [Pedobacter sp. SG908]NMN37880.1 ferric-dicitrate binding protein FerR (iron transport regulator) [Pedobacter sp. SG918]